MADIKPFKAFRPAKGMESQVAALPYDVYDRKEAREVVKDHPFSFLNIDRPETFFEEEHDMYADEVYRKAHDELQRMISDGLFMQDSVQGFYLYELAMLGHSQTGIVACASIDDYLSGVIKKHENTREEKEQDRIRHIDTCNMQTGPIFLAYRRNEVISQIVDDVKGNPAVFDFVSDDGIQHRGWLIFNPELVSMISKAFASIGQIYIADGHHRAASAVKVGLKRREQHPEFTGDEEFNYFLSVLFPDDELLIMDYNRVVKDLYGMSENEFLNKVSAKFDISVESDAVKPTHKGEVGMLIGKKWYRMMVKPEYTNSHPVDGLDVSMLQNEVLSPIHGITDPRIDSRIDFVGGIRGLSELERRAATDCAVAFSMYPTSIDELFSVADAGLLMPPKSTWFEPKLRSGLFLHKLE